MTNMHNIALYGLSFLTALILSIILTPAARAAAQIFEVFDIPHSKIKTHKEPVPYFGGVSIFLSFTFSLLWIRVLTSFPTGTLTELRGILLGSFFIFATGLVDDSVEKGLHYRTKFFFQFLAAATVMSFGIKINFIEPEWLSLLLTFLWIVGLTNAVNLIDIMDGLSGSVIFVASLAFLFISLPTESIYVNFTAAALAGAVLGFLPYNLSKKGKIFMGDSGSLFLGFVVSVLALGTSYKGQTNYSVFAPILILAIPIFDTAACFFLRILRGKSPFLGSKDHFALRLEILGWDRKRILFATLAISIILAVAAFYVTKLESEGVIGIFVGVGIAIVAFTVYILRAKVK